MAILTAVISHRYPSITLHYIVTNTWLLQTFNDIESPVVLLCTPLILTTVVSRKITTFLI